MNELFEIIESALEDYEETLIDGRREIEGKELAEHDEYLHKVQNAMTFFIRLRNNAKELLK